jgi:tetratricopeptide (TPR) repeat protein
MPRIRNFRYKGQGVAKDFSEAANWYRKALDGGVEAAAVGLAQVYLRQGNKPEAMKAVRQGLAFYEKQVRSSPDEASNYAGLSWANLLCGQATEGEAQARKGLSAKPADTRTAARLKADLGHAFLCQGITTQAIEQYREALKLGYEKDELLDDFGLMKSALPEFNERIEAAEKELALTEMRRDTMASEPQAQPLRSGPASEASAAKRRTNSLGMVFVGVPGADVLFCIWETRVRDYAAYASANSGVDGSWRNPGFTQSDEHPVVNVSWDDAQAFCQWLTTKERGEGKLTSAQSYRLPTDAQWSVAVGLPRESGSTPEDKDGKIKDVYPWGSQWPPPSGAGNYGDETSGKKYGKDAGIIAGYDDGYVETAPVGSFKPNQFGLYDLGGNVWEFCEDCYLGDQKYRVLRGASWGIADPDFMLSSKRNFNNRVNRNVGRGFRVVLSSP